MPVKGIESLVKSIKEDSQAALNLEIESANREGKALYQEMMDEAKQRLERIKHVQEEEVRQTFNREVKQSNLQAQIDIDAYKHELVNRVLDDALNRLQNMDEDDFVRTLDLVLSRENGKHEKPRISVDSKYYPTVLKSHGTEYQVLEDESMTPGFVLKFRNFDVDCEFTRLFQYNHDELVKKVLVNLFGDSQ